MLSTRISSKVCSSNSPKKRHVSSEFHALEGVLVAKKDFNAPKHEDLDVPNLQVIKALQSLTSRGFVKTQFSWQWYYYTLTPEGVEYLREWFVALRLSSACRITSIIGSTCPAKSFLQHTKRLFGLPVLPLSALVEERALTDHLVVVTARDTARRKKVASSDNTVLEGEVLGSKFPINSPCSYYNHQKPKLCQQALGGEMLFTAMLPLSAANYFRVIPEQFGASSERIDYVPQMTILPLSHPCFDNLCCE